METNEKIVVVPMSSDDVHEVVQLHMQAFPNFFLTFLGHRFLKEFYRAFIKDKTGIALVAKDSDSSQILGVAVGPLIPSGFFKRLLLQKWWAFGIASITAVIKKPTVIGRLCQAFFYRGHVPPQGDGLALLSSIGVTPQAQSKGAGKALVEGFIKEVKHRGGQGLFLTTDAKNNDTVNNFYRSRGFVLESSYVTPQGRCMNRYILRFNSASK